MDVTKEILSLPAYLIVEIDLEKYEFRLTIKHNIKELIFGYELLDTSEIYVDPITKKNQDFCFIRIFKSMNGLEEAITECKKFVKENFNKMKEGEFFYYIQNENFGNRRG